MILFKPEHVEPILAGVKTQTRRTGKRRWNIGSIHQCRLNFKAGAIPFAKVRILAVKQELLGDITEVDSIAEGYSSVVEYIDAFRQIYGKWNPDEVVWVVDFELVGA